MGRGVREGKEKEVEVRGGEKTEDCFGPDPHSLSQSLALSSHKPRDLFFVHVAMLYLCLCLCCVVCGVLCCLCCVVLFEF